MASEKMERTLKNIKKQRHDIEMLSRLDVKNMPELNDLPMYTFEELKFLRAMINSAMNQFPEKVGAVLFGELGWAKNNYDLRKAIISLSLFKNSVTGIGVDMMEILLKPFDETPLFLNHTDPRISLLAKWRLKIRK